VNDKTSARNWAERFQPNPHVRHLTLDDVARMSACREHDFWYVARCDGGWTIGRRSDRRHYPIVVGATPIAFDTMATALR